MSKLIEHTQEVVAPKCLLIVLRCHEEQRSTGVPWPFPNFERMSVLDALPLLLRERRMHAEDDVDGSLGLLRRTKDGLDRRPLQWGL